MKTKTLYIAEDGSEFLHEEACRKHEQYLKAQDLRLNVDYAPIDSDHGSYPSGHYCEYSWYKVDSDAELEILKAICPEIADEYKLPLMYPFYICLEYTDGNGEYIVSGDMQRCITSVKAFFAEFGILCDVLRRGTSIKIGSEMETLTVNTANLRKVMLGKTGEKFEWLEDTAPIDSDHGGYPLDGNYHWYKICSEEELAEYEEKFPELSDSMPDYPVIFCTEDTFDGKEEYSCMLSDCAACADRFFSAFGLQFSIDKDDGAQDASFHTGNSQIGISDWIVITRNSNVIGPSIEKVTGTAEQVRQFVLDNAIRNRSADAASFRSGPASVDNIFDLDAGFAWSDEYAGYSIDYAAYPEPSAIILR